MSPYNICIIVVMVIMTFMAVNCFQLPPEIEYQVTSHCKIADGPCHAGQYIADGNACWSCVNNNMLCKCQMSSNYSTRNPTDHRLNCPTSYLYENGQCVPNCTLNQLVYNFQCVPGCPDNTVGWRNICVVITNGECMDPAPYRAQIESKAICMSKCPAEYFTSGRTCIPCHETCDLNKGCVGPSDTQCQACAYAQVKAHAILISFGTVRCTMECPDDWLYNQKYYSWQNASRIFDCVDECDKFYQVINGKDVCTDTCPTGMFFAVNGKCSFECPSHVTHFRYYNDVTYCSDKCQKNVYTLPVDTDKYECVQKCPAHKLFVVDDLCSSGCPESLPYYRVEMGMKFCQLQCGLLTYPNPNNECTEKCEEPYPFYLQGKCLSECPPDKPIPSQNVYIYGKFCTNKTNTLSGANNSGSNCPTETPWSQDKQCVTRCSERYITPDKFDSLYYDKMCVYRPLVATVFIYLAISVCVIGQCSICGSCVYTVKSRSMSRDEKQLLLYGLSQIQEVDEMSEDARMHEEYSMNDVMDTTEQDSPMS